MIKYLRHTEINIVKWDKCIHNAFNGIVYAYSWYLSIVCKEWEALVDGDYETVMPLTCGKKYGINYLYQPYFNQQLGIFSLKKLSDEVVDKFVRAIPRKYKLIEINLNTFNKLSPYLTQHASQQPTYQLDLIKTYDKAQQDYSQNTRRNIAKARKSELKVVNTISIEEVVDFAKDQLSIKIPEIKELHYEMLKKIINFALRFRLGELNTVVDAKNQILAAAFFITSHNKTIFLLSASSPEGKANSAMFLLVDEFIKRNSEKNLTLDFEGSNQPEIARFYSSFGAVECKYHFLQINHLPWYVKLLKRIVKQNKQ